MASPVAPSASNDVVDGTHGFGGPDPTNSGMTNGNGNGSSRRGWPRDPPKGPRGGSLYSDSLVRGQGRGQGR